MAPDEEELAKMDPNKVKPRPHVFRTAQEAELSYDNRIVGLHDLAMFKRERGDHVFTTVGRILFNDRIERALFETLGEDYKPGELRVRQPDADQARHEQDGRLARRSVRSALDALVLDAFKELGFHYASQAGITISKNDVVTPPDKEQILERYEGEVAEIHEQYDPGLITMEERHEKVVDKWQAGQAKRSRRDGGEPRQAEPDLHDGQLGSARLVHADPAARRDAGTDGQPEGGDHRAPDQGELHGRPDGARVLHLDSRRPQGPRGHGAANRGLGLPHAPARRRRTGRDRADRGLQAKGFIEMPLYNEAGQVNDNLVGRVAAQKFETKRGRVLLQKNEMIGRDSLHEIVAAFEGEKDVTVPVRSVLKCEAEAACAGAATECPLQRARSATWETPSGSSPHSRSVSPAPS